MYKLEHMPRWSRFLSVLFLLLHVHIAFAESAWPAPLARQSLLLDIVRAGDAVYAVGERGHILSLTPGSDWQQQNVPTQVLLTAVDFHNSDHGCAVGHEAVIVCTRDGGRHWHKVSSQPALQAPLLDVHFVSAEEVIAVGAYSLYMHSHDGGDTWKTETFSPSTSASVFTDANDTVSEFTDDYDLHLNAIAAVGQRLVIAAEAGRLYESSDGGSHWQRLPSPYGGSWFSALAGDEPAFFVGGLRGHLFENTHNHHWQGLETATVESITGGLILDSGVQLFIGHGGTLLYRPHADARMQHWRYPGRPALLAVVLGPDNDLLFVSDRGLLTLPLSDLQKSPSRRLEPGL